MEFEVSQQFRLEAASLLARRGQEFDVWDVLSLAHTIEHGKVKDRDDFVKENREGSGLNPDAVDTFLKTWGPKKNDDGGDRYEALFVIMGPSGKKAASFPTWPASEGKDKEELRADLHKWLDSAIDLLDGIA